MAPIYVLSGFAGNLASCIFLPNTITVGASGAAFGLYGVLVADLIINWGIVERPWLKAIYLIVRQSSSPRVFEPLAWQLIPDWVPLVLCRSESLVAWQLACSLVLFCPSPCHPSRWCGDPVRGGPRPLTCVGIDNFAHMGGLIQGFLAGLVLLPSLAARVKHCYRLLRYDQPCHTASPSSTMASWPVFFYPNTCVPPGGSFCCWSRR